MGSDLKADATLFANNGEDWAAWNTAIGTPGALAQSPVQGEINSVRLKGFMRLEGRAQKPPDVLMHVIVLRPQGDGTVALAGQKDGTGVSANLDLPLVQDPTHITSYDREQLSGTGRLCVQKGDYIALAPTGGFGGNAAENPEQIYVYGAQFQVFARSPGSSSDYFERHGAFDFSAFRGKANDGQELLMNATIGTRENARYTCRTAAEQRENLDKPQPVATPAPTATNPYALPPATVGRAALVKPRKAPKVRGKKVKLPVSCSAAGACAGTLALRTYAKAKRFTLAAGQTATVTLTINRRARKKLKRRGARLTVKAMLVSADGYKQNLRFKIKRA